MLKLPSSVLLGVVVAGPKQIIVSGSISAEQCVMSDGCSGHSDFVLLKIIIIIIN